MAPAEKPLQLLEISLMSAQNLEPVARKMKTYAIAWINSERKLSSRIDAKGYNNPTWNDKFIFHVDEEFLRCKTSGITIEIYSTHWYRDILVGTVHVLVGKLVPPNTYNGGMRCVAVQVRRPSGRTQGILNIGVEVVDNTLGMSLHKQVSGPSVGLRDLMGMEDDESHLGHNYHQQIRRNQNYEQPSVRPTLFRSKSEVPNGSIIVPPLKFGKPGPMLSTGMDLQEKPKPKGYRKKASSFSIIGETSRKDENKEPKTVAAGKPVYNTGKYILLPYSMISASEAPSEGYPLEDDASTSIVGEWTSKENGEDVRLIKLDKWRSELPPLYDPVFLSESNFRSNSQRKKGHDDGGDSGLFSILGNICGYERRCVCGKPPSTKTTKAKSLSRRFRSSSIGSNSSLSWLTWQNQADVSLGRR